MTELERYQQWCEQAPLDEAGRAALAAMQNDETERKGCFGAELRKPTSSCRFSRKPRPTTWRCCCVWRMWRI